MTAMTETHLASESSAQLAYPKLAYAWYVLGVLNFVYMCSFIDRIILNLLVGPIRRDLQITDTEFSLLTGFSFAVFYTLFGLPLGRLADTGSRRGLIAAGFAVWSLFAGGCGLARNFTEMLIMRMGVGVGEASLSPAAYSLITDYFPQRFRSTALSIYLVGALVGAGLALVLGGVVIGLTSAQADYVLPLIGAVRSWQLVFFIVGFPGLLVALLLFTVAEPERTGSGSSVRKVTLSEAVAYLERNRAAFACLILGAGTLDVSLYGAASWIPTFYIRHHHLSAQAVGTAFGLEVAVFGALGVICGGLIADRLAERGYRDACIRICLFASILWIPSGVGYLLVSSADLSLALLGLTIFIAASPLGTIKGALMEITPARMRGQAGALLLFSTNLVGLGMGSTAVALFTDYFFRDDNMVGSSLVIVTLSAQLMAIALFWAGLKPFVRTKDRLNDVPASGTT